MLVSIACKGQISRANEEQNYLDKATVMPQFPGGIDSLNAFIRNKLQYPKTDADCEGNVYLSFIVETTGQLSNIKIEKSLCSEFDAEAIKFISKMPKWTIGQQHGKDVRVKMYLPITFKI